MLSIYSQQNNIGYSILLKEYTGLHRAMVGSYMSKQQFVLISTVQMLNNCRGMASTLAAERACHGDTPNHGRGI